MTSQQHPANENDPPGAPPEETAAPADVPPEVPQAEIARLTEEAAKLKDQWIRAVAEAENIRKRSQREQEETARYAITAFARDLVGVLENLKRASESIGVEASGENERIRTIGQGVDLTLQELLAIFQKHHIRRVDPLDQAFDHNLHQAVAQVERGDVPPGTVVQVVQAGYVIHDRLLRPAMVVVSKQGEPPQHVDTIA